MDMKQGNRRLLAALLSVMLCFSLIPISARAGNTYDPDAAAAWAKEKDNVYDTSGECATFVSHCLQAGGLTDVSYSTPGRLVAYLEDMDYGTTYEVSESTLQYMKPGDVIAVFCSKSHDSDRYWGIHTIFVTEVNQSEQYLRYSARNNEHCNEYMDFSSLLTYAKSSSFKCNKCGTTANNYTVFVSMNNTANPTYDVFYYKNLSGKNYLLDTDFSGSLDPEYWASRNTDVATISVDSSTKHNGYNSLKIVNTSAGSGSNDLSIQTSTRRNISPDGYVGDNKSMILSFWAKSSRNGTKAYFRWGFESVYRSVTLSTSWQKYTVRMDKTTDFGNYIHPYMDSAGTVWLAEMQLEDGTSATDFAPEKGGLLTIGKAAYGGSYPLPSVSAAGYNFQGWYTEARGGTKITSSTAVQHGHNCFYAHWAPATYTVSYNANGGTGAPGSQTKTHGTALTLSSVKPTRADASAGSCTVTFDANGGSCDTASLTAARTTKYTFRNWNTKADGTGTSYNPGASYTANAAVTLYAQWNSSVSTAAVTLPTPTRDGFIFRGWAASSTAASGAVGSYTPTGNVTLYAAWQEETTPPEITGQPESITVAAGEKAVFTVTAEGRGLTYQWYVQPKGSEGWDVINSATEAELSFTADAEQTGRRYRCVVTNPYGSATSEEAVLTVVTKPKITTQPKAASVKAGKKVTFKVKAVGGALKYQWYYQKPGTSKWVKISKAVKATYSFKAGKSKNGYKYRCYVTNQAGTVKSKAAKLTVK